MWKWSKVLLHPQILPTHDRFAFLFTASYMMHACMDHWEAVIRVILSWLEWRCHTRHHKKFGFSDSRSLFSGKWLAGCDTKARITREPPEDGNYSASLT
jgi:hypothetical protein